MRSVQSGARLVGQKHFIEKNGFKVFKPFYTEYNMKNAAGVMQFNTQIPPKMVNDTHHSKSEKKSSG